jgi:hypothetical protein
MAGTRGDVKSDDIPKFRSVGDSAVLLAGDMSQARELLACCSPHIEAHDSGGDDLSITKLRMGLVKAVAERKRAISTAVLSAELGIGWDEVFNFSQAHPNATIWMEAWAKIRTLDLEAALIVGTFTDDEAAILAIDVNGRVSWATHWAAVGSGSAIASAYLTQRDYDDDMPLEECLYRILEAKTAAEKNPYVGQATVLQVFTPSVSYNVKHEYLGRLMKRIEERRKLPNLEPIAAFLEKEEDEEEVPKVEK